MTHRDFYTQKLLHTEIVTHKRVYTQTILHTNTFFTHRDFYTHYTQKLLHTDAFTYRRFYTQTLLHTNVFIHTLFMEVESENHKEKGNKVSGHIK